MAGGSNVDGAVSVATAYWGILLTALDFLGVPIKKARVVALGKNRVCTKKRNRILISDDCLMVASLFRNTLKGNAHRKIIESLHAEAIP
jgi:hypothetical protein